MSAPAGSVDQPQATVPAKKPRVSIFLATACGLGYLPKAPGTWGALGGLVVTTIPFLFCESLSILRDYAGIGNYLLIQTAVGLIIAVIGVWSAGCASRFWRQDDPQKVVIDEVSGQHLAIVLGCALPLSRVIPLSLQTSIWGYLGHDATLNWKYLLAGFILFRVFDIWKPFPARQAESLRAGWGIMADDWMAGVYAAIGLWIARGAGL
ncbi:MAG TPA: phosphatidylglycerophosphatase A [Candidatus Acidoferrales bacterium]|nr:phosphatidylglycerophosphatase A [Candidatus Acidoferrales bacterium]